MVEEGVYVQTVVVASFADVPGKAPGINDPLLQAYLLAQELRNARTDTSIFVGVGADRIRVPQWSDHIEHEY